MEASRSTSHRSSRRRDADLTFSSIQAGRGVNAKLDGRQSWHSDSWSCRSLRTHNTQLASVIYLQMLCRVSTHRQAQEISILICIRLCSRAFSDRHSSGNWHWDRALVPCKSRRRSGDLALEPRSGHHYSGALAGAAQFRLRSGSLEWSRARAAASVGNGHWSLAMASTVTLAMPATPHLRFVNRQPIQSLQPWQRLDQLSLAHSYIMWWPGQAQVFHVQLAQDKWHWMP